MAAPPTSASMPGLALDARSLDALRRDASRDPQAALRQAAGQFEALFMQQLLKSMRDAMPRSGLFDGPGQDVYVGMLDQQLSQSLANRPGGLAEIIARQLERHIGQAGGDTPADASAAAASTAAASTAAARPAAARKAGEAPAAAGAAGAGRPAGAQADFIERMWPHAVSAQRATGVPAAFVVGQAALESGWGRSEIRHADGRGAHNLFGVKATGGWTGPTVDVTTTEYVDGKAVKSVERFRAYGSYAEAFRDWASLMSGNARYAPVLRTGQSAEGFAQGLQRAGYATDPRYADKLERTINQTLLLKRLTV